MTGYSVRAVADAIGRFLNQHPHCADTVEGIEQWWLRPQDMHPPIEVILRALELLQMEGLVECRSVGARTVWRLRRDLD